MRHVVGVLWAPCLSVLLPDSLKGYLESRVLPRTCPQEPDLTSEMPQTTDHYCCWEQVWAHEVVKTRLGPMGFPGTGVDEVWCWMQGLVPPEALLDMAMSQHICTLPSICTVQHCRLLSRKGPSAVLCGDADEVTQELFWHVHTSCGILNLLSHTAQHVARKASLSSDGSETRTRSVAWF